MTQKSAARTGITHVLAGYSPVMLAKLDAFRPPGSLLVLEEPDVIAARGLEREIRRFGCVAALVPAPTQDENHPERLVAAVHRPPGVRAVVPVVEYGVLAAATLAEAWGLPGAGVKAARVFRDKALLREAAARAGLAQPAWRTVHGPADLDAFRAEHGPACVLKPANRQASLGVQLLADDDDSATAWLRTTTADEPTLRARSADRTRFLAERRLRGPEVSVEALVHAGTVGMRNITAKRVLPSRHPVETGHTLPARLPARTATALHDALAALIGITGFGSGVLHSEWILEDGVPHLVECAGRLPGGGITVLIDLAYDTDILRGLLAALEGGGTPSPPTAVRGAAVRFLTAPPGTVTRIEGVETARAAAGVHAVSLQTAPGRTNGPVVSSWERAGSVIATGDDAAQAGRRAEAAAAAVRIHTAPARGSRPDPPEGIGDAPENGANS
ncbi:hypothetical protein GCM10009716_10370 [Streptomyces sodiiphilus]|uniref:ATP-grasp domain-containing protein n=1 Tax=Streptomyces sodiiphilus TaxID=226217 RepID=A0ABP5A3M0_9ACTN